MLELRIPILLAMAHHKVKRVLTQYILQGKGRVGGITESTTADLGNSPIDASGSPTTFGSEIPSSFPIPTPYP